MTFQLRVWGSLSTLKLRTVLVPGPGWPCSRIMLVPSVEAQGGSWPQCGQQPLLLPGSVPALMSFFRHMSQKPMPMFCCLQACPDVMDSPG